MDEVLKVDLDAETRRDLLELARRDGVEVRTIAERALKAGLSSVRQEILSGSESMRPPDAGPRRGDDA